jgi:hypothetical protein
VSAEKATVLVDKVDVRQRSAIVSALSSIRFTGYHFDLTYAAVSFRFSECDCRQPSIIPGLAAATSLAEQLTMPTAIFVTPQIHRRFYFCV